MARTPLFRWMGTMFRTAMATPPSQPSPAQTRFNASESDLLLHTSISRRDFLKTTLGATGAIISWSLLAPDTPAKWETPFSPASSKSQPHQPVPIIGAGLGGLVTAYRLHRQGIPCELYEASHRLGGRVFTRHNFNRDGMFVELGGELIDTGHEDLIGLCEELRVPLERFVQDELGIEPALFYSQGKVYNEAQVLEAFQGLALSITDDLKRCFPDGEIRLPTYSDPANAAWLDQLSLAEYLAQKQGLAPDWLLRLIRSAYIGEYGLEPEQQSALNLALLIGTDVIDGFRMFGDSDETMRVKGGNSRLVEALTDAIKPHVPIHYGHRLTRLAWRNQDVAHSIASAAPSEKTLQLGLSVGRHFRWLNAEPAVLALPFATLRQVTGLDEIGLPPVKLRCIREWGYGTNSKQMIGFQYRFWRADHPNAPASSGELFTDLPSQCYWETSRLQPGKSGILTNFTGGQAGENADAHQWQVALQDLKPLFGDLNPLLDGHTAFFNWRRHPWNQGSYTCPQPGQYTSLVGVAQTPELAGRLFFAGEHCSLNSAGYMNGAVESGNTAARQISEKLARTAALSKRVTLAQEG